MIFAAKRKAGGPSGLKWEFPGGKVEAGESRKEALIREIREELEIDVTVNGYIGASKTEIERYKIELECYWCSTVDTHVTLNSHVDSGWFSAAELTNLDWAVPDIPIVKKIIQDVEAEHRLSAG